MAAIRLVSWNRDAVGERQAAAERAGLTVDASPFKVSGLIGAIRKLAPAAMLIDLDRKPAYGRAVAIMLRTSRTTCSIPIVFAGGAPEKVERARLDLPGAFFTDWKNAPRIVKQALKHPAIDPIQPKPYMARWAGSSLAKKLGFKAGVETALLGAPDGFDEQIGDLPEGAEFRNRITGQTQMALWFVRSRLELESEAEFMSARLPPAASLWIIFPKQTGRLRADFNLNDVRAVALAAGMVDYKICAVDEIWTGMKFARKRTAKTKTSRRTGSASAPGPKPAARKSKNQGNYRAD